jgi:hypothetical protein
VVADEKGEEARLMDQRTRASGRRRYSAGDVVKFRIVLGHKPHLKEVRLAFVHEFGEQAVIIAKVEPHPRSDIAAHVSRRSSLDAEITIPRGRPSGIYRLGRIGYETAGGRLGHLFPGEGLPEASMLTFELVRESMDEPDVVEVAFADD